ncbi:MAG: hypothetical protein RLO08_07175 [Parvibaculaceae bacterium]
MMRVRQDISQWAKALLTGAMAAGLLAACATEEEVAYEQSLPCPAVGILGGTESLTLFSGEGRDITDVVLTGEMERVVSECEYDIDDGIIYVDLALRGSAEIGPAATSREITVPVFIALTEVDSRVLRKDVFPLTLAFPGNQRSTSFIHTIEETKVPFVARIDGSAYEILLGFQLTEEQLAYNKRGR